MLRVYYRFYGSLNDFLPRERRQVEFEYQLKERGAVKDSIEAIGVPHPEVDRIVVNGEAVNFAYQVQDRDRIGVYPMSYPVDQVAGIQLRPLLSVPIGFVLDVHLGKLATYLRLLGFDTLYRNDYSDEELADISSRENRVLLTQDRALLKRGKVVYGYLVRSSDAFQQISEVLQRYDLFDQMQPLSRCPRCNGVLQSIEKAEISDRLPPLTRQHYSQFSQCQSCQQIYWQGAHQAGIERLLHSLSSLVKR